MTPTKSAANRLPARTEGMSYVPAFPSPQLPRSEWRRSIFDPPACSLS
jgi:hypothetical protein